MSESELKSFDRVADVYDATRGLPPEAEQAITAAIESELRAAGATPRLLEVGIGTGRIAVPLAAAGVRVTGIDISTKMLGLLREKRRDIDVMLAEASQPPLRPDSFDAVLFVHILHLVPDAAATVRAVVPLVRGGGVILHGQDARSGGPRGEADAIIEGAITEVTGLASNLWRQRDEGRTPSAWASRWSNLCEAAVLAVGGTVEERTVIRWTSQATGRRVLERLARRDFSSSWRISDAALPVVLERVTPRIEALFGGLDREVAFERSFSLFTGRLPS